MAANSKHMTQKQWDQYVSYLDTLNACSDRVWREHDEPELQIASPPEDFRDQIDRKFLYEELHKQMKTLYEREMIVLIGRFGIETNQPLTFRQLSPFLDICSGRVQQIQAKALRKLRHPLRSTVLKRMLKELS